MQNAFLAVAWLSLAAVSAGCSKDLSSPYEPGEADGCQDAAIGTWRVLPELLAPSARSSPYAFWTGSELLVWGGYSGELLANGGLYDPVAGSWREMNGEGAPSPRANAAVAWTGVELVVWGGFDDEGQLLPDGASYDLEADAWSELATDGAPSPRAVGSAVWTGSEVIVWGGATTMGALSTGARYDPAQRTWAPMSTTDAPEARNVHGAVWSGSEMLVWGGFSSGRPIGTGGRYDPLSDTWLPLATDNAPSPRTGIASSVVWTGDSMFVWGGHNGSFEQGVAYQDGGLYDPIDDRWTGVSTECAPEARAGHTAVWTGSSVLIWGGQLGNLPTYERLDSGYAFDPARDHWTLLAQAPLEARDEHAMVWTGAEALIWGGYSGEAPEQVASRYGNGASLTP